MTGEGLRYDALVEDALRGVVRRSLGYAAERGLPGDHHFYVTFNTGHPGVKIPAQLRQRYPNEMTIVLQFQYWGLEVGEETFGVTLSFADVPERLTIPFAAITAFADPSVQFGLQFESAQGTAEAAGTAPPEPVRARIEGVGAAARRNLGAESPKVTRGAEAERAAGPRLARRDRAEPEPAGVADGDKVIPLDIFRKR